MPRIPDERGRFFSGLIAVAILFFAMSDLLLLVPKIRLLIEEFGTRFQDR